MTRYRPTPNCFVRDAVGGVDGAVAEARRRGFVRLVINALFFFGAGWFNPSRPLSQAALPDSRRQDKFLLKGGVFFSSSIHVCFLYRTVFGENASVGTITM